MTVNPARHGPFPGRLASDDIAAYAAATGEQTAHRYAEVSGDWAAYHSDLEVARAAGFEFVNSDGNEPDSECLWHQDTSFTFEAAANGATTISNGRLELRS